MTRTLTPALLVLAACGGAPPATGTGPTPKPAPPPAGAPPEVSFDRIERIARACLAGFEGPALDWNSIDFARGKAGPWRVRVDEDRRKTDPAQPWYVDLVVDPVAGTCDGKAFPSPAEATDVGLDAVIAIARRCHQGAIADDRTRVTYNRLATGALDRAHFDVTFYAPGTAVTFPMPHYSVDLAAATCAAVNDRM